MATDRVDETAPPRGLSPAARTALFSVAAAVVLIGVKVAAGVASGSLALVSEAVHSASDLVAALLAFFALRVAERPPDAGHPYGHGKAEHLSALMEGVILVVASLVIVVEAVGRLSGGGHDVTTGPWVWAAIGVVIVIDGARTVASVRASRRLGSPALAAGAVHFASDMAGTAAVAVGLILVEAGYPAADAVAALCVAALVLVASGRLMQRNADILLDRAPPDATEAARRAIAGLGPDVELRRLRVRTAAGRHFADVVVAVPPGSALGQAHGVADAVEDALGVAVPGMEAVVHVEPGRGGRRERVRAAAQSVEGVREVHNVRLMEVDGGTEASLHLKLPGGTSLWRATAVAGRVREAVRGALPGLVAVRTHLEPLDEVGPAARPHTGDARRAEDAVAAAILAATGLRAASLRTTGVEGGLLVYATLTLPPGTSLAEAHAVAARARRTGRDADPAVVDVFVETLATDPAGSDARPAV